MSKRIFPRANKSIAAWYVAPGGLYEKCSAVDFGVQGACLELDHPFPPDEVELCFELEEDWVVKTRARKIWERQEEAKYFVGISYKPLRSSDKHLIGPWIHKTRRQSGGG